MRLGASARRGRHRADRLRSRLEDTTAGRPRKSPRTLSRARRPAPSPSGRSVPRARSSARSPRASRPQNPKAKVKVTVIPFDAAHDKIASAIAANQTPDISLAGTTWVSEFAGSGALDATPTDLIDKSEVLPGRMGHHGPWTARRTASRGTSRRASSTTARTSPRRPASRRRQVGTAGRLQGVHQGDADQGRCEVGRLPAARRHRARGRRSCRSHGRTAPSCRPATSSPSTPRR